MLRYLKYPKQKSKYKNEINFLEDRISDLKKEKIFIEKEYNSLKEELLKCIDIDKILHKNIKYYDEPEYKEIKSECIEHNNTIHKLKELIDVYELRIEEYNQLVTLINFEYKKYRQCLKTIEGVKHFIKEYPISSKSNVLIKFGTDRQNNLLCFYIDLKNGDIFEINNIYAYVFFGEGEKSFGMMQLRHDYTYSSAINLIGIEIHGHKRLRRGTFMLKCLEDIIIKELNYKINDYNESYETDEDYFSELYSIKRIYGHSGSLSSDTSEKSRKKFYESNGYFMKGNEFEKFL